MAVFLYNAYVTDALLKTKFYIPPRRSNTVSRPHLIERLNQGLHLGHKLTLISAPAGFGKTTLIADFGLWISQSNPQSSFDNPQLCWLSLDEGDNDPTRFLTYFITALQTLQGDIGKSALTMLQSAQPPPVESILTTLLNDITAVPGNFILVLDDYHLVDSQAIDEALAFFVQHLPPNIHLALTTREDPNLPLALLRARGQLTELRIADLRFTPEEAAAFLNQAMGLNLPAEEVAALEERTEGWIAGLQLAALSMQRSKDTAGFIKSFTGSHHYVLDYLLEEVLQRHPGPIRSFLLSTSILDRLSGPLCDAVTEGENGRAMLEALERGNLFVVPLDDRRQWYRYHHLFAGMLQARLAEEQPARLPILNRRASIWYERHDLLPEAIRHALAAADFERAAGLIELARPEMDNGYQSEVWLGWVKALPDEIVSNRPVLLAGYGWALLDLGQMEGSEARLRDAERWLEAAAAAPDCHPMGMIVVDQEQFQVLPSSIAVARAYRAMTFGDIPGTATYAQQALDLLPAADHPWRRAATSLLGLAQYWNGNLLEAHRFLSDLMIDMQNKRNIQDAISLTFLLAEISATLGRLHAAASVYQRFLQIAASQGEPLGTSDLYRGLSELYREWGDLQAARQHLQKGEELGKQAALTDWTHRLYVTQARLKEAQGGLEDALNFLEEAQRHYVRSPLPNMRPIAALKTRIWIKQDRVAEAYDWVREQDLAVDDELDHLREFEHITLARVLIAGYKNNGEEEVIQEARALLSRLLAAAEAGGRMGSAIEILLLQALAHQAQGDIPGALPPLERALALAEPQGYVQIFVNEGSPMSQLLSTAAAGGIMPDYTSRLLNAFPTVSSQSRVPHPALMDPLSERERDVLRLLGTELSGPQIAGELLISLNTLRTHTKNIYSKLGVNNRRSAVRRAEELHLK